MAIDEHSRARGASESEAVRSRKKRRKRNKVVFVIEIIVLVLVLAAFGVWIFLHNKMEKMQTLPPEETFEEEEVKVNEDLPEQVVEASEDYTMFMIFGVDARNNSDLLKNANADTDMICSINNETGEIKLVSILRDTFVETSTGKWTKLTDVYAGYGVQEALQTINRNFDLNITKYVSVNWKSVAQVVDLLGGIDVELSSAEVNFINNNKESVTEVIGIQSDSLDNIGTATYHLNGVQTVTHARDRSVGHHDLSRAERQQGVIGVLLSTAKAAGLSTLNDIVDEMMPGIGTNFTTAEILGMITDIGSFNVVQQSLFPFTYVDQERNLTTAYVYSKYLTNNVTDLHNLLFGTENYEPSETVKRISDYVWEYRNDHP